MHLLFSHVPSTLFKLRCNRAIGCCCPGGREASPLNGQRAFISNMWVSLPASTRVGSNLFHVLTPWDHEMVKQALSHSWCNTILWGVSPVIPCNEGTIQKHHPTSHSARSFRIPDPRNSAVWCNVSKIISWWMWVSARFVRFIVAP